MCGLTRGIRFRKRTPFSTLARGGGPELSPAPPPVGKLSLPALRERSTPPVTAIGIYTSREMPDCGAFLPLLLTQEGGEGWGEEARFVDSPLSGSLPTWGCGDLADTGKERQ